MTLLDALGGGYGALSYPGGDRHLAGRALDHAELVVSQPQVDSVGPGVAGDRSSAGAFLGSHDADFTVKQKSLAMAELTLYDKAMTTSTTIQPRDAAEGDKARIGTGWITWTITAVGRESEHIIMIELVSDHIAAGRRRPNHKTIFPRDFAKLTIYRSAAQS